MSLGSQVHEQSEERNRTKLTETKNSRPRFVEPSLGPNYDFHMLKTVVKFGLSERPLEVGPGSIPGKKKK